MKDLFEDYYSPIISIKKNPITYVKDAKAVRAAETNQDPIDAIKSGLHFLETGDYIWDMRAWDKYHDPEEVRAWVMQDEPDHKNCGHAGWQIKRLKELKTPLEDIINAILKNTNIRYAKRIVPCMKVGFVYGGDWKEHPCPKTKENGGYHGNVCIDCA